MLDDRRDRPLHTPVLRDGDVLVVAFPFVDDHLPDRLVIFVLDPPAVALEGPRDVGLFHIPEVGLVLPADAAVPPQPMTARHGQIIRERDFHLFFAGVGVARVHLALLERRRVLVGILVLVHGGRREEQREQDAWQPRSWGSHLHDCPRVDGVGRSAVGVSGCRLQRYAPRSRCP